MGSGDPFVHLHVHTEYSMLDGASRVGDLLDHVQGDGQPAVAMTDHGVLFGLVDFYRQATDRGVKPILGIEAYQAHGSRFAQQRTPGGDRYHHLTILAQDDVGYRNLVALSTRASLEGHWYKPRIDTELLAEHSDGLIVLSGCLGSQVNECLTMGDEPGARRALSDFRDIVGPERLFVEQMDHGIAQQRHNWPLLDKLARELGLRTVITNDSHYTQAADAEAHDALLCIQTGSRIADTDRLRFSGDDYYVKTSQQMRQQFAAYPEALDSTLLIAEMCDAKIEFDLDLLPRFPCPDGVTEADYLRQKVFDGARARYGDPVPTSVVERLDYELSVIEQMGFPAYFLIVADLCEYARSADIRVGPGRGSAGGSAVAYCTGITAVDPIRHGLIFERFLNPARAQMPDIDIDFDDRRRGEMIRYAADRYGDDHVAQIVTFGTIKAKSAIRDAARVLDEPFAVGDRLCKMMPPPVQGQESPLAEAYAKSTELRNAKEDPSYRHVLETAERLEGLKRQHGIHAAAVIIGGRPLAEVIPLLKTDGGEIVTQYEMGAAESLGLLKMDFLGLRNLTVISDSEIQVRANRGVDLDLDAQLGDMDDPAVYEMLATGHTLGVFQLDSPGMQALVRKLVPDSFEDISALLALYRPGPLSQNMHNTYAERKNGREPVAYDHVDLKPILGDTYAVIVYQEQVMRIATDLGGFSLAEADALRKAVGKKQRKLMEAQREKFVDGVVANDYDRELADRLWDLIETFAEYGFNKSHTVAYGVVSYQTAWLKTHYPVEYMAALLTSVKANKDSKPLYLNECRRMGIAVLPPDVNTSDADFTASGDEIRFGLSAVRGVGAAIVAEIVRARVEQGVFTDFRDFCAKVAPSVLNKRVLESLILAGAFATLGHTRRGLLLAYEPIAEAALARKRAEAAGQFSLFDAMAGGDGDAPADLDDGPRISDDEFDKRQLLAFEREMLGLYVSDHPLFGTERLLAAHATTSVAELVDQRDGAGVTVAGVLTGLTKKFTRKGDTYLVATLEDLTGAVEVVFWPSTYRAAYEALHEDEVLVVAGRVESRDESVKLTVNSVSAPDLSEVRGAPVVVTFDPGQCTAEAIVRLKSVLASHPGDVAVHLCLTQADGSTRTYQLADDLRVERRPGLFGEIKARFGPDAVDDPGARTFAAEPDRSRWAERRPA